MKNHLWKLVGAVALLVMLIAAVPLAADEHAVDPINSLRVYKQDLGSTTFPYWTYTGPFDLTSFEAPEKDFVQFNPAIFVDPQLRDGRTYEGHPLSGYITCAADAAEKVHARMWYERVCEPLGATYPAVPQSQKECTNDIVFEYTYMMLDDDTLDPVACPACQTQLVFPMVGNAAPDFPNQQIGLEGYDVNNDGHDEVLKVERIYNFTGVDTQSTIVVAPQETTGSLRLKKGEVIEFFDYALKIIDEPTSFDMKVEVAVYYTGFRHNEWLFLGQRGMYMGDFVSVDARQGPVRVSSSPDVWRVPAPVERPWFIEATYVGTDFVEVKPYRILTAGETFFVDGAEYDVAAIFTEGLTVHDTDFLVEKDDGSYDWPDLCTERKLKYITIRNPLPKGDGEVMIPKMTVYKREVPADTSLPMLPPFNMEHDMVDDINIPDSVQGYPNRSVYPDVQLPDNVIDELEICYGPLGFVYGCKSGIHRDYNTIWERIIENAKPYDGEFGDPESYIAWTSQTKEGRFDTNLMEEKILEPRPAVIGGPKRVEGEEIEYSGWDEGNWYGPTDYEIVPCDATDPTDVPDASDVVVTVNDSQVVVFGISPSQLYVDLGTRDYIDEDIEISYCYWDPDLVVDPGTDLQTWQWINIETRPWDYTEFILPLRPDITDPDNEDGDYILVSSWETQQFARVKFAYDAAVGMVHSADIYVNDAEYNMEFRGVDANSLRAYGFCTENAEFPYTRFDGPFNLGNENDEKPLKDFIVHNPAYMNHWDGGLNYHIKADADANQKVHLRTWYVPKYLEPAGKTEPSVPGVSNYDLIEHGDIVNEYTYLLLDDKTNDPTHGSKDRTQLIFPMAGLGGQVGLDRYDVNNDGTDEIMRVLRVMDDQGSEWCAPGTATPEGTIIVSAEPTDAGNMQLNVGDRMDFFDYAVELVDTSSAETKALFDVWYIGHRYNQPLKVGSVWLANTPWGAIGNTGIVEAGKPASVYRTGYWEHPWDEIAEDLEPVVKPFAFLLDHVSTNYVSIRPYRALTAGETFFVDGAEYDVAAIGVVQGDRMSEAHGMPLCALKYITIRNPIPKCDSDANCHDLLIPGLTVYKRRFGPEDVLPVLPPFNDVHDRIDDINIPENVTSPLFRYPDMQSPDNVIGESELCSGPLGLFQYGCTSGIHAFYNTIEERWIRDVDPLEFFFIAEEKETRFDTNLLEEKFKITYPWDIYVGHKYLEPIDRVESTNWAWGPVSQANHDNTFFADCNGDGPIDGRDVTAYVNGTEVPVLAVNTTNGRIMLDSSLGVWDKYHPDTVTVEVDYCYTAQHGEYLQRWQWINIETLPWHFTEFVLPDIPEAPGLADLGFLGDYILVSSFTTQDDVRVKFDYDPSDGTGLYVNSELCEPARVTSLTSNSPVEQYATIELFGAVVNADDFAWDFGELTGCTGEDTLEPTCPGNVAGEFEVMLTAMNECGQHTAVTTVVVKPCLGDFEPPFGIRDINDILAMLDYWNLQCSDDGWDDAFDLTGDCRVGLADVIQVVAVWNTTCPGGTP